MLKRSCGSKINPLWCGNTTSWQLPQKTEQIMGRRISSLNKIERGIFIGRKAKNISHSIKVGYLLITNITKTTTSKSTDWIVESTSLRSGPSPTSDSLNCERWGKLLSELIKFMMPFFFSTKRAAINIWILVSGMFDGTGEDARGE